MTIAPDEVYMAWPSPNVLFLWILVSVYVVHGKRNTISHVVLILRKFQTGSNWKRFLCSISYWYMKSIYHIPLPSSPLFTLPFPQVPPPHCTYFTVLHFIINIEVNVQRGFLVYPCCGYTLLWFNPFHCSPLPLFLPPPIFNSFQCTSYILYLHRYYVLWY
jgi:hypothetical protein